MVFLIRDFQCHPLCVERLERASSDIVCVADCAPFGVFATYSMTHFLCSSHCAVLEQQSPLKWDNAYFEYLVEGEYELWTGPGGHYQWKNLRDEKLMMMTTDMALVHDAAYYDIVQEYAKDIGSLNVEFAAAWNKLVTDGTLWARNKKCIDVSSKWKNG